MRAISFVLVALAVAAAIACGNTNGPSDLCGPSGATQSVNATTNTLLFVPETVTVAHGQSVCWQNNGSIEHFVIGSDTDSVHILRSDLQPGATYLHVFLNAGTFPYHCRIHGLAMKGTVIVT